VRVVDDVVAVLRAPGNLTVLAVDVPVKAPVIVGLPVLGADGFDGQRDYCRVWCRYTGARFEAVAALNNDPDTLGPAQMQRSS
jgi:hypothetical protein